MWASSARTTFMLGLVMLQSVKIQAIDTQAGQHARTRRNPSKLTPSVASASLGNLPQCNGSDDQLACQDYEIHSLPGWGNVEFGLYGGYITVDEDAGRALYFTLAESLHDSATDPLVIWLNGGPGCSSLGGGFFSELGPFFPTRQHTGLPLEKNKDAWNKIANLLFIESPAFVGFSFSNRTSDIVVGDQRTTEDSVMFMRSFLEVFPNFKGRDLWVSGESYGGHYVPLLTEGLLNDTVTSSLYNVKGFMVGNAWTDAVSDNLGQLDFLTESFLLPQSTAQGIIDHCPIYTVWPLQESSTAPAPEKAPDSVPEDSITTAHVPNSKFHQESSALDRLQAHRMPQLGPQRFKSQLNSMNQAWGGHDGLDLAEDRIEEDALGVKSDICEQWSEQAYSDMGDISVYDVYEDECLPARAVGEAEQLAKLQSQPGLSGQGHGLVGQQSIRSRKPDRGLDPCIDNDVDTYLNRDDVQKAMHANTTGIPGRWNYCSSELQYSESDAVTSMLPVYHRLMERNVTLFVYSGTVDASVPTAGTFRWIKKLNLTETKSWQPWTMPSGQVGGYRIEYDGLTLVLVRGAGHMVPYTQPARAFHMFQSMLQGNPPNGPQSVH